MNVISLYIGPENTHLLCKAKYPCTTDLLFDWFGFHQTSKSVVNPTINKAAESKQIKQ